MTRRTRISNQAGAFGLGRIRPISGGREVGRSWKSGLADGSAQRRPIPIEVTRRLAPPIASIIWFEAFIREIRVIRGPPVWEFPGFLASGSIPGSTNPEGA